MKNSMFRKSLVLTVIVLFIGVSVIPIISGGDDDGSCNDQCFNWWHGDWQYRKQLYIEDASPNFALKIIVYKENEHDDIDNSILDCENHCNTNFSDLRFVNATGMELGYWMEEIGTANGHNYSIIWVNISNEDVVCMYYGNPSAETTSNGNATFAMFEDMSYNCEGKWNMSGSGVHRYWHYPLNQEMTEARLHFKAKLQSTTPVRNTYYVQEGLDDDEVGPYSSNYTFIQSSYNENEGAVNYHPCMSARNRNETGADSKFGLGSIIREGETYYWQIAFAQDGTNYDIWDITRENIFSTSRPNYPPNRVTYQYFYSYRIHSDGCSLTWEEDNPNYLKFWSGGIYHSHIEYHIYWIFVAPYSSKPAYWFSFSNEIEYQQAPFLALPYPAENTLGCTNQSLNPELSVIVADFQGDLQSVTFSTNATGTWETIGINVSSINGTYSQVPTTMLSNNGRVTTYWWRVNATDSAGHWRSETYRFSTRQYSPIITNLFPINGSIVQPRNPMLSILASDPQGDLQNITFRTNESGIWQTIGCNTSNPLLNGTYHHTTSVFNAYNYTYYWSVNATDGKFWTNETYHFTTEAKFTWFNPDWPYVKQLNLSKFDAGVIKLKVFKENAHDNPPEGIFDCENHSNANFSDIRFASPGGILFPYWTEEIGTSDGDSYAVIWVNMAGGKVYMYYGNSNAPSVSSGNDTFTIFEDMSYDCDNKWHKVRLGTNEYYSRPIGKTMTRAMVRYNANITGWVTRGYAGHIYHGLSGENGSTQDNYFSLVTSYDNFKRISFYAKNGTTTTSSNWVQDVISVDSPYIYEGRFTNDEATENVWTMTGVNVFSSTLYNPPQQVSYHKLYLSDKAQGCGSEVKWYAGSQNYLRHYANGANAGCGYYIDCHIYWLFVAEQMMAEWTNYMPEKSYLPNNPPDTPINLMPTGRTTADNGVVWISCYVADPDGDPLNVYFYNNDTKELVGQRVGIVNATASIPWSGLSETNTYSFYIYSHDGENYSANSSVATFTVNAPPNVTGLMTNNQTNPIRLIKLPPYFNWTYYDRDADMQQKYQIQVGITENGSGMWDSGQVSSSNMYSVYAGSPLSRGVKYYVRVRMFDGYEWNSYIQGTFQINQLPDEPSNPCPTNDSTGVNISTSLSWVGGDPDFGDTVTYDVYFGTSTSPPKVSANQTDTTYNPDMLDYITTYYWGIIAWDNHNTSTSGPLWNFTTESLDNIPPEWRNQGQNRTAIQPGECIKLYAQGKDNVALDWAWLATNESGEWKNFTGKWWNTSWAYRKEITTDHTKVDANLMNFPVLISNTSLDFANHAQSDGDDLIFTSSDNQMKYNHEIESYNSTTGELIAWVNITSLSSIEDTVIYLYYGNNYCDNQENKEATWSSDYKGVYHLHEYGTGTRYDSTINTKNLIPQNYEGDEGNTGKIDGADWLSGEDWPSPEYLKGMDNTCYLNSPAGTYSAWIYVNDSEALGNEAILTKQLYAYGGWNLIIKSTKKVEHNYFDNDASTWRESTSSEINWQNDTWYYIVATRGPSGNNIFINGEEVLYTNKYNGSIAFTEYGNGYLNIGGIGSGDYDKYAHGGHPFGYTGMIDEVRISFSQKSLDFIKTEFNNQNDPKNFSFICNEESYQEYRSPMKMQENDQWQWSNFTWQNSSIPSGTTVGWRIYYNDTSGNINCTDIMSFVVSSKPEAVIDEIYPLTATYAELVSFKGHGITSEGTIVDYNWTSDIDGKIGSDANFSHSRLSVGTHLISFKVKNSLGVWSLPATETLHILPITYKPDLAINSLLVTSSDYSPIINDTIWINATVHNIGSVEAENVTVSFYDMSPENKTHIGDYLIEYIPSQPASRTASIQWNIPPDAYIGYHVINVTVDPYNTIDETYERNNIAYLPMVIREQEGDLPPIIGMNVTGPESGLTYAKGQHINVFGDSWYEYENWTLPVCGGKITVNINETGDQWTTWTSGSKIHGGEYSCVINAPEYTGNYHVTVTLTDFTLTTQYYFNFTVIPGLPDLIPERVWFNNSEPIESQHVNISAKVWNFQDCMVTACFYDIYNDEENLIRCDTTDIPSDTWRIFSVDWVPEEPGPHTIKAYVDPLDNISESNEFNNWIYKNIYVWPNCTDFTPTGIHFSDMTPYCARETPSHNYSKPGQNISIYATVKNKGGRGGWANVTITDVTEGRNITTQRIYVSGKGGSKTTDPVVYNFTENGTHTIRVNVTPDPDNEYPECPTNNNQRNEYIYVRLPKPDLYVKYYWRDCLYFFCPLKTTPEISIDGFWGSGPTQGVETVTITETVYNNDFEHWDYQNLDYMEDIAEYPAFNFSVNVTEYDDVNNTWDLIDTVFIEELYEGESTVVSVVWNTTCEAGRWHTIRVRADPHDLMKEAREDNNVAYYGSQIYVYPNCPDPTPTELTFSDQEDRELLINATIENIGGVNATNVTVTFWDEYDNSSIPFNTTVIPFLRGKHGSTQLSVDYTVPTKGDHIIRVEVDPDNELNETDDMCNYTKGEDNNNRTCSLALSADLAVYNSELAYDIDSTGGTYVHIGIPVHNHGNFPVFDNESNSTSFSVDFYYEETLINTSIITREAYGDILPNTSIEVSYNWSGYGPESGVHYVYVKVDLPAPGNITESIEGLCLKSIHLQPSFLPKSSDYRQ